MKKITLSLMTLLVAGFALPAAASELMVAATMQRCTTNEDCTLVTNSCKDNCGFVPVNKINMPVLQNQYQTRCGKPMEANPSCNMNPPISAACVNARCTIGYAYQNNASAADYQSGAYAVPEAPTTNKVQGDYSKINDRHGFTAYDLPQNEVKENTVGTINSTVYVPPSAPVSGGNYVPVTGAAPSVPPAAVPTNTSYATPTDVVPAAPVPTPPPVPVYPAPEAYAAPAAPATPELVPPVAPTYNAVPAMTPSLPNQPIPTAPEAAAAPAVPATPYQYVAPETVVTAPQPPAPTPVAVAPPGSKPIPPSDLKPVESSIPAAGGTIPVNPEDPGALPPEGTKVILKGSQMETVSTKAFGATAPKSKVKAAKVGDYN
jgi:hypothetical protein